MYHYSLSIMDSKKFVLFTVANYDQRFIRFLICDLTKNKNKKATYKIATYHIILLYVMCI